MTMFILAAATFVICAISCALLRQQTNWSLKRAFIGRYFFFYLIFIVQMVPYILFTYPEWKEKACIAVYNSTVKYFFESNEN